MKKLIYTILFVLVAAQWTEAQQSVVEQADNLLLDSRFDAVVDLVDKNLPSTTNKETQTILKNKKATALIGLGKLEEARRLLDDTGKTLPPTNTARLDGITKTNVGMLQLNQGRSDLAEETLKEAIQLFSTSNQTESLDAAQAHANLGMVYISDGKYKQAEEQLQRSLMLRQKQLKDTDERIAASYNDLGLAYAGVDTEEALDYYEKALDRYQAIHGNEHPKIAISNINIGIVYRDMKLYGDAVNNFETALKIWEKTYSQPHPAKAIALFNLGQTYVGMGDSKTAMQFYEKALSMYQSVYGNKHPDIANVLNSMGAVELADRRFTQALDFYQRALQANVAEFNSASIYSNPGIDSYYNGFRLLQTLVFKAEAFEALYYGKTLKFSEFQHALEVLQLSDKLIDKLRRTSNNEGDKLQLGALSSDAYAAGVRIAYAAGQNAFKKKPYYALCFYFGEKSKGAVLQAAINESNAKAFVGIPADLLEKERTLKSSLALNSQKLAQGPSATEEAALRQRIYELTGEYETFVKSLENQYPEYYKLKYDQTLPTVDQLKSSIRPGTTVLSYFMDDKDRRLYLFMLTNKDFRIEVSNLPQDFEKTLTGYRNSLYYEEESIYLQTSNVLSPILVPQRMPGGTTSLIVIPAGRLGVIPFEPLLTASVDESTGYATMPFLVRKYTVSYEFSASLMYQKKTAPPNAKPSILLCAPVKFPAGERLAELPGTRNEVENIAALFDSKNLENSLLLDLQATETAVKKENLSQYSYLHFATHGIVDETDPELSRIYLQTNSATEDGNLFAGEIYALQLSAHLVTLSACQTGLGKIVKGEGVIGLSRALVYAGAQHLIVSFWNVADESTALLMREFYTELLSGEQDNLADSLRDAKLKMLASDTYSAPYYWAPFILIGK